MKQICLLIVLSWFFTACVKETPEPVLPPVTPVDSVSYIIEFRKGSVRRNGPIWNANFSAQYYANQKSRFFIEARSTENGYDHRLSIYDIPTTPGYHIMERGRSGNGNNGIPQAAYFVTQNMDALINSFAVDTTRANQFIEILRYDSIKHVVEGRFQTFLEGPNNVWFLQDTISLKEGKFHLRIK